VVWAAKGVAFREPLNPQEPADDQDITLPFRFVIEIIELTRKFMSVNYF
jgi:hypothetical protein